MAIAEAVAAACSIISVYSCTPRWLMGIAGISASLLSLLISQSVSGRHLINVCVCVLRREAQRKRLQDCPTTPQLLTQKCVIHRSTSKHSIRADYRHLNSSTGRSLSVSFRIVSFSVIIRPVRLIRYASMLLGTGTLMRTNWLSCSSSGDQDGL